MTLALMLFVLWLLVHGYHGLGGDAQIYAFQALARIQPGLSADLYLQNTSQDQYTIFSPFFGLFIRWLGVENAARLLTMVFTLWFLAAAWKLAALLTDRVAWLAVALLLLVPGDYGGSGVFRLSEGYLTARLPAEAAIITALACHLGGRRLLSLVIAVGALFIHPLMAFPGLLLLILLWLPPRAGLIGAIAGILVSLGVALAATRVTAVAQILPVIDADWLEVVRERSQFLFLQLWSPQDWDTNARPFLYLILVASTVEDARIRRLCGASMVVCGSGVAVALIAGLLGPVALMVQGQAWRWVWVACLLSTLLLPFSAMRIWRDEKCGPLCAVLALCGLVFSAIGGSVCIAAALILWRLRLRISEPAIPYLKWLGYAIGIAVLLWGAVTIPYRTSTSFAKFGNLPGVRIYAALLAWLLWRWLGGAHTLRLQLAMSAALLIGSMLMIPGAFRQVRFLGADADVDAFSDWSNRIPATSTVFVHPTQDVGAFVWFTLRRPNYLALDQSAGVVFSRATALEIRRRSLNLLPLTDPTWKILSGIRGGANRKETSPTRPLTAQSLVEVCADPLLGFVIAPEDVGFHPRRHTGDGALKDWHLYDCAQVRSMSSI